MAGEGGLITAAATLMAAGAFLLTGIGARPARSGRKTWNITLFFLISSLFLTLSALRQVAAYIGQGEGAGAEADRVLFYALIIPAAVAILPLVSLTMRLLTTRALVQRLVTGLFGALVPIGVYSVFAGGIDGPVASYWGTEWELVSPVAKAFLIGIVTLPAIACSVTVLVAARGAEGPDKVRLRRVGMVFLVYYLVFTLDALALPGAFLVVERLVTAGVALFAYDAYRAKGTLNA